MAIIGLNLNRINPEFEFDDFIFWMPHFQNVLSQSDFEKIKAIANNKIFKSIWGTDWEYAMSLCIAHYLELRAANFRVPASKSYTNLGGGQNFKGVITSMSVGDFSKSLDIGNNVLNSEEAYFWNQTSYGASLMALYKTKAVPSIFVVSGSR